MSIELIDNGFDQGTLIKVIGVGGGGGNAVEHMIKNGVTGVEFVCANTDAQALRRSSAGLLIQLGQNGLGAGGKPDKGRDAAEAAEREIRDALDGANMVFITAGMGGGTGTGAAPVVARIAKELGILTVGVVTKPFHWEGKRRMGNAENGLAELEANVDSMIVVLNEKLLDEYGDDITQHQAYAYANDVLRNAVGGIAEVITTEGYINSDFEDVRTVMGEPGKAMMGTGAAEGADRARLAAEKAVACPLLEGVNLSEAKGVLVLVSASNDSLKLSESKVVMETIAKFAAEDAHTIYGQVYDDSLGDQLRVTVVATGLAPVDAKRAAPPLQVVVKTGTDNVPMMVGGTSNAKAVGTSPVATALGASSGASATFGGLGGADYSAIDPKAPRVWHNPRTNASSLIDAMSNSGKEEYEIPAFLRRQAD